MAYSRETFKDKVEEHTGGALLEFYKAQLAEKNGQTKWVAHWRTEVSTLLDRNLVVVFQHEVRGFKDTLKAANEVFTALKSKDAGYRRIAENTIKRDYGITKVRIHLDDMDTEAFWDRVAGALAVGTVLDPQK